MCVFYTCMCIIYMLYILHFDICKHIFRARLISEPKRPASETPFSKTTFNHHIHAITKIPSRSAYAV